MKMDIKDKKILYELCSNSRQPSTAIAKKVGLSREVVEYRIKRLENGGVITRYITLINVERLGYKSYTVFLLMQNFTEEKSKEILSYLKNHPAVRWMIETFGQWDIIMRISAKSEEFFDGILTEITQHLSNNLRSFEVLKSISQLKSVTPMDLFFKKECSENFSKKAEQNAEIDLIDLGILKEISANSRKSLIELSQNVKLTAEAVKYRLKKIEKAGLIKSYSCIIDMSKMDYSWYILLCSINPMSQSQNISVATLLKYNKKIWFGERSIGRWNLLLELLAENTEDFHKTLVELRSKIGEKLNSFELLLVSKEHVNERLPKMIFEELKKSIDLQK